MSKRDILAFLFKWKYSLAGYWLLVVLAVVLFVYLMPQKYEATAAVLIESNRGPVMRTDLEIGTDELAVLNSEMAIIASRTVLAAAVDRVGAGESEPENAVERMLAAIGDWMIGVGLRTGVSARDSLIESLGDDLEVEPQVASNVISISLRGKGPQRTADIVNAVTDAYIAHHLQVFSPAGTGEVLRQQLDRLATELDEQRAELRRYKQRTAISALGDTQQALTQLQTELTLDIGRARGELTESESKYGTNNAFVTTARGKLANLQAQLDDTLARLRSLEAQQGRVREIEIRIGALERSYEEYQRRYDEQRLGSLSNAESVNVRVIEYASVPVKPRHSRLFYIILAIAGGLVLSVVIALIREYFDHRVSDPDLVQELLGLPSLGCVERF